MSSAVDPNSFPILPIGTSLAGDLQGTFGVVIVAVIISAFLTGILTIQTYTYYTLFPEDPLFRKFMVALILVLDFIQFGCITDFGCAYFCSSTVQNLIAKKMFRVVLGSQLGECRGISDHQTHIRSLCSIRKLDHIFCSMSFSSTNFHI